MRESQGWESRRYVTLIAVVILHVVAIAALLTASAVRFSVAYPPHALELLLMPPAKAATTIRPEKSPPQRISGHAVASIAPLLLSAGLAPPAAAGTGQGSGVDWRAEARRALQAYDIRSGKPAGNTYNSGSSAQDDWWPRARHHVGEQYKTLAGDWIVWVTPGCYQVADAAAPVYAPGAALPQTICPPQETGHTLDESP